MIGLRSGRVGVPAAIVMPGCSAPGASGCTFGCSGSPGRRCRRGRPAADHGMPTRVAPSGPSSRSGRAPIPGAWSGPRASVALRRDDRLTASAPGSSSVGQRPPGLTYMDIAVHEVGTSCSSPRRARDARDGLGHADLFPSRSQGSSRPSAGTCSPARPPGLGGEACGDAAIYVADAPRGELPLLGGGEGDWTRILGPSTCPGCRPSRMSTPELGSWCAADAPRRGPSPSSGSGVRDGRRATR